VRCQNYYEVPGSIDGEWECDKNKMHWICGDHISMWIYYTEIVCTAVTLTILLCDILGVPDLWGCYCELHPGRMGLFGSFPKEALQRSDAGNL
jgi:hypothetical protein